LRFGVWRRARPGPRGARKELATADAWLLFPAAVGAPRGGVPPPALWFYQRPNLASGMAQQTGGCVSASPRLRPVVLATPKFERLDQQMRPTSPASRGCAARRFPHSDVRAAGVSASVARSLPRPLPISPSLSGPPRAVRRANAGSRRPSHSPRSLFDPSLRTRSVVGVCGERDRVHGHRRPARCWYRVSVAPVPLLSRRVFEIRDSGIGPGTPALVVLADGNIPPRTLACARPGMDARAASCFTRLIIAR